MKNYKKNQLLFLANFFLLMLIAGNLFAQDSTEAPVVKKVKPVKNTFGSIWIMDNQSVMVPVKGTLQMDIQHRFGTVTNGVKDMYGLFAPSNIRLGLSYAPISKLYVGAGLTKERMQVDLNAKYSILEQTPGVMPVSVALFGNMVIDTRDKSNFTYTMHRYSYFSQVIIARKITDKFSLQIAPDFSWMNNVAGYVDVKGNIQNLMHNYHFALSMAGRYKVSLKSAITVGFDQPLTQHPSNNPHPNICFGFETTTSSHAFQVFAGNYYGIVPQSNNMLNQNDYTVGQFLVGFNISHLWNF